MFKQSLKFDRLKTDPLLLTRSFMVHLKQECQKILFNTDFVLGCKLSSMSMNSVSADTHLHL